MPDPRRIESRNNPRLRQLRAAFARPTRAAEQIALEGFHLVEEALASSVAVQTLFVASGHESLLDPLVIPASVEILSVPAPLLASAVTTESPQPVAALFAPPRWPWSALLGTGTRPSGASPLLAVLAGVQDPGNLGTILRSAEAFGATGAILLPGTVSPWNPKAMRASAGSVFRLPTLALSVDECFRHLAAAGIAAVAAMPRAENGVGLNTLLAPPIALLIGSEGSGIAPEIVARCQRQVTIPCPGPVESLNAAVAASILLYEASRATAPERAR